MYDNSLVIFMRVNIDRAKFESDEFALNTRVRVTPSTIIKNKILYKIISKNLFTYIKAKYDF